jgi:hypothetical protein
MFRFRALTSFPFGTTSEIIACYDDQRPCTGSVYRKTYRDGVPWTHEDSVESLICPEFPDVVEAEGGLGNANAPPSSEHQDEERVLEVSIRLVSL